MALAATTCMSGPPWMPGKTLLSMACASVFLPSAGKSARSMPSGRSRRANTMPPRGPRSVLWVVLVTMWACGKGFGYSPATIRPSSTSSCRVG